ncbi:MAG TPA: hypothetical protein VFK38_04410 [Candidatus Limnocylindrales bacterium]|nr:hypothetical protein [Candidatus Limnocylindrales bacterium]
MSEPTPRPRLSIEERAARREQLLHGDRDRFQNLVRSLQAGRELSLSDARRQRFAWHPIARSLAVIAAIVLVEYLAVIVVHNAFRDARVETWQGADNSVQSGQRLAGCPTVNVLHDEVFPTWLRYGGRTYRWTERYRPVLGAVPGETGFTETGYSLGSLRLLVEDRTPDGRARRFVLIHQSPAVAAKVFEEEPDCS